jgi:hypothetical protein
MYSPKRRFRLFRHPAWAGGGGTLSTDVLSFARSLSSTYDGTNVTPTDGGLLTLNSQSVGNYEYTIREGDTTISSFTASDWFTATKDTTSSWIVVNGNLTINSGQTLIPSVRKLFTVVYVTGNLTVNGSISMTARGANHSGTGDSGGSTTAVAIRLGTGTFSAVVNPQIAAAGGAGGAVRTTTGANNGTAGASGTTGGGGSGYAFSGGTGGSGSAGTCFTGGSGGGGGNGGVGTNAGENGGKGGNAAGGATNGGTGNPGGDKGSGAFAEVGNDGTGGTLIVIVEGSLSGSGTIVSNGTDARRADSGRIPGGASGGGSVNVFFGTNPSNVVTVTANGGQGNTGGNGGNGTARKLAIGSN